MKKRLIAIFVLIFVFCSSNELCSQIHSAEYRDTTTTPAFTDVYIGIGFGLDYGGFFGGKVEFDPIKNLGIFGSVGFYFNTFGWNIGFMGKIIPDRRVSPNILCMYGTNSIFVGIDDYAAQYNATSTFITPGVSVDFKIGRRGHKLTAALLIPIRSKKFNDIYNRALDDPNLEVFRKLYPVVTSVGFNFML